MARIQKTTTSFFFAGQVSYQHPLSFDHKFLEWFKNGHIYFLTGLRYDNTANSAWLSGSQINRTVNAAIC